MAQVRTVVRVVFPCALAFSSLAMSAAPVSANGIGDVYVATPAHVLEIQVSTKRVVNRVPLAPAATGLAFANSGRSLYLANGTRQLVTIDIASISVSGGLALPAPAAAVAVPLGGTVLAALPALDRVAVVDPRGGAATLGDVLPGPVNMLAADRRDPRALAASKGQSWVAVVDPATGHDLLARVSGSIAGLAVDRQGGLGYVITTGPAQVLAIDLQTGRQRWALPLREDPIGVASTAAGPVVASGNRLWRVNTTGARAWQTTPGVLTAVAASDDGQVALALEGSTLDAWTIDGQRSVQVPLGPDTGGIALVAMTRPSSLLTSAAGSSAASVPHAGQLPATDTLAQAIVTAPGETIVAGLAGTVILSLLAAAGLVAWSLKVGRRP